MNRRELVVGSVFGAAIGSGWVAGFGMLLRRQAPALSVIGVGESVLTLLDAGNVRVLIAAGPGDPRLTRNLGALLGVFRPRIDLVIGSESGVAEFTTRTLTRYGNPRRMILDRPTGISLGSHAATGPAVLTARLPKGIEMRIVALVRNAWQTDSTPTQSWIVTIDGHGQRCSIADSADVLELYGDGGDAVGIVGATKQGDHWDMLREKTLLLPSEQIAPSLRLENGPALARLFPHDPVTITFRPNGIAIQD